MNDKVNFENNLNDYKIPPPLLFLINYSNNLSFKEEPDYHFLIKGFTIISKLIITGMTENGLG